jgi:hypothetical protein
MAKFFLYVTTDEIEMKALFSELFHAANVFPEFYNIDPEHGEIMEKRIGFNPMLSLGFDKSVPLDIIDKIGLTLRNTRRFAYMEDGRLSRNYSEDILPRRDIEEFLGPRIT